MKIRSFLKILLMAAILATLVICIVARGYVHFFDIPITGKPEFATLLVALLAVMSALWVYYRQANAQIYIEYNKRYEQIMHDFPQKVRLNFAQAKPGDVCPRRVLLYLNLCSEEFYMWQEMYISHKVWTIWEGEIKRVLQTELIRSAWKDLSDSEEFKSFKDFQKFVDEVQEEGRWKGLSEEFKSFKDFQKFVDEVQEGGSWRIRMMRCFKWRAKRFL